MLTLSVSCVDPKLSMTPLVEGVEDLVARVAVLGARAAAALQHVQVWPAPPSVDEDQRLELPRRVGVPPCCLLLAIGGALCGGLARPGQLPPC